MKKAVKWDSYFCLPNNGLKAYFGNVVKGRDEVIYGSFADVQSASDVDHVLEEWAPHLKSLDDRFASLLDNENDQRGKVGPMSIMKPLEQRMEDIDHYYDDILLSADPVNPKALAAVVKEFSKVRGIKVRSQKNTVDNMRKSTNSGSPYFTKRRDVVSDTLPVKMLDDGYLLNNQQWRYCAILGWRGQEGGPSEDDVKQRVVWMFPFGINIRELQVYQPLIESCQRFNLVAPWVGMDAVDERMTKLFDTKDPTDLVICTDFSKFDQHFNAVCQQGAEFILRAILSPDTAESAWLEEVFPVKYNIPLAYDWKRIRYGNHGMGSGSGGTNADETLLHRALQHEAAIQHGAVLNPHSMCLGDDGVLTYPGITVDDVLDSYTSHGLEMNASKQYVASDNCVFLRRWHSSSYRVDGKCVGVYSTFRALGRLMYRERTYKEWSDTDEALRELSILENVKYHPLADDFAAFCMQRSRTHLGSTIPGFLDNIEEEAKKATDRIGDYLSYTQTFEGTTGISQWWIVQYVRSH